MSTSPPPPHPRPFAVYGHIHDYERYLPVLNYTVSGSVERRADNATVYVSPGATVHITAGGAGNSEMRKGECPPPQGACRWVIQGNAGSEARLSVWGAIQGVDTHGDARGHLICGAQLPFPPSTSDLPSSHPTWLMVSQSPRHMVRFPVRVRAAGMPGRRPQLWEAHCAQLHTSPLGPVESHV